MLKLILLILAVSIDGFAAAIGLGSVGIKIPVRSAIVISLTGTVFLALSVFFADMLVGVIPQNVCGIISAVLLIILGVLNLFHGFFKRVLSRFPRKENKTSLPAMLFDGTKADIDHSKTITCGEALIFSIVLSADSVVTGISVGLGEIKLFPLIIAAFLTGILSVLGGAAIGKKLIFTGSLNLQWLCGIMLIAIALLK